MIFAYSSDVVRLSSAWCLKYILSQRTWTVRTYQIFLFEMTTSVGCLSIIKLQIANRNSYIMLMLLDVWSLEGKQIYIRYFLYATLWSYMQVVSANIKSTNLLPNFQFAKCLWILGYWVDQLHAKLITVVDIEMPLMEGLSILTLYV